MSTTKRRAIQILHISTFQFTFKCGYNNFISKYIDINSLHVTQIKLLHNKTCCSTQFARFRCKKRIFACKLSDDFSGFVDTCGTGKRNGAGGARSMKRENFMLIQKETMFYDLHVPHFNPSEQSMAFTLSACLNAYKALTLLTEIRVLMSRLFFFYFSSRA